MISVLNFFFLVFLLVVVTCRYPILRPLSNSVTIFSNFFVLFVFKFCNLLNLFDLFQIV